MRETVARKNSKKTPVSERGLDKIYINCKANFIILVKVFWRSSAVVI